MLKPLKTPMQKITHRQGLPSLLLSTFIIIPLLEPTGTALTSSTLLSAIITALMSFYITIQMCIAAAMHERMNKDYLILGLPFACLVLIGIFGVLTHPLTDALKDGWYYSNAALTLVTGYVLAKHIGDFDRHMRIFIFLGTGIAAFHLIRFSLNFNLLSQGIYELRKVLGRGYFEPGLALIFIVILRRSGRNVFRRFPQMDWLCALICLASIALSFSRNLWLFVIVMFAALFGCLDLRHFRRLLILLGLISITGAALLLAPTPKDFKYDKTIIGKLQNSLHEVKPTETNSLRMIMSNWRGYESERAWKTFHSGSTVQVLFGQGFGQDVDIGFFIELGNGKFHSVPIMHNGYMTLLVKTGIVGLGIYVGFLIVLIWLGHTLPDRTDLARNVGQLLIGISIFYFYNTAIFGGLLNKYDFLQTVLFLGGLLYFRRIHLPASAHRTIPALAFVSAIKES